MRALTRTRAARCSRKPPSEGVSAQLASQLKYCAFAAIAAVLPRFPAAALTPLVWLAGTSAYLLTPNQRSNVSANLVQLLGPATSATVRRRHARRIYRTVVQYYVDLLRLPVLDVRRFERGIVDRGYDTLRAAVSEGHGVILVTIHYGAPELTLQATLARGLRCLVLVEPLQPPALAALYARLRSVHGHRFVPVSVSGAKEAIRTLRRGGVVILMVDRDIRGTGVAATFCGAPITAPPGAVELARRTGALVLPALSRRLPDGSVEVMIGTALPLIWSGDRSDAVRRNLEHMLSWFEPPLRRDPGQWLVLERLWRPTPPP